MSEPRCSFCDKAADAVACIMQGVAANICSECIVLCVDILTTRHKPAIKVVVAPPEPTPETSVHLTRQAPDDLGLPSDSQASS